MIRESSVEGELRELVKEKGLRKVARDLGIGHASLYRSLKDDSNIKLNRVKMILDYFGYELKIRKKKRG
jgi:DNA-binding phage protein